MSRFPYLRLAALSALLVGCDKLKFGGTKKEDSREVITTVANGAGGMADQRLIAHASKLGFVSRLPADTQIYIGTLNVKEHMARLATTSFFQEVAAYLDDKTPAPTTDKTTTPSPRLPPLWTDDAFISVGAGGAETIALLAQLGKAQSDGIYKKLTEAFLPASTASDAKGLDTLLPALADFSFPEVMLGLRAESADAGLASLLPESARAMWATLGPRSEVTLGDGSRFSLHEGKLGKLLDALGPVVDQNLASLLKSLREKPLAVAWGYTGGHAVITLGPKRPEFRFAAKIEDSLLAKKEWDPLALKAGKALATIGWMDAMMLEAVHQDQWLVPLIQSLLSTASKNGPMAGIGSALERPLKLLAGAERRYLETSYTHAAFCAWWSQGLHLEMHGGLTEASYGPQRDLQLAGILNEPDVLFGYAGTIAETEQQRFSEYAEAWGGLVRDAGWAYLKGAKSGQPAAIQPWIESEVLPPIEQLYQSASKLSKSGFGLERGWVITMKAQKSGGGTQALPAVAKLAEVADKRAVARAWLEMEPAFQSLKTAFPMLAGSQEKEIVHEPLGTLDAYLLPIPTPWPDVSPCVALGNEVWMISTSKGLAESLNSLISARRSPNDPACSAWKLNVPLLRNQVLQTSASLPETSTLRAFSRWLAPLGQLRCTTSLANNRVKRLWSWEMKDPERFD